jgi:ABC-type multidrug transport system fused ATPase/permease subunit
MLQLIRKISRNQEKHVALLALLILLSNILEGFGISLVLPVFQKLLHQNEADGALTRHIDALVQWLGLSPTLLNILLLLNAAFVIKTAIAVFAKYYSARIAAEYQYSIQTRLFSKLMDARLSMFIREKQGTLINALTLEIQRTAAAFVQIATWISALATTALYFIVAMKISVSLAILSGVLGFICVTPIRKINRRVARLGSLKTVINEDTQNFCGEVFSGIKYVKASSYQEQTLKTFRQVSRTLVDNACKVNFLSNISAVFAQPISIFILSVLLYMSVSLTISLPELFLFLLALMRLLPTLTGMSAIRGDINTNVAALDRIEEVMALADAEKESTGSLPAPLFSRKIELKNISFRYSDQTPVIENVSLEVPFGSALAITGPSGSGKTTMVDLIIGLFRPSSGQILIDEIDLNGLSLTEWRNQIAYVSQDPFLFHDSVRQNILVSKPDATEAEIIAAAQLANAHDFILTLEKGYDTIVGDRGSKLSGGQKQRIALARALLKHPRLLILDEATSALDHASEQLITKAIRELKLARQMAIIIIAHRLATIEDADSVFKLEKIKISV